MEEQDTLINVQEGVNRQEYPSCISCAICIFITVCLAVGGILFIDYLFAKNIWL